MISQGVPSRLTGRKGKRRFPAGLVGNDLIPKRWGPYEMRRDARANKRPHLRRCRPEATGKILGRLAVIYACLMSRGDDAGRWNCLSHWRV